MQLNIYKKRYLKLPYYISQVVIIFILTLLFCIIFICIPIHIFMLVKFNALIVYGLIAMIIALLMYPHYITLLKYFKAGKQIRENDATGQKSQIFNSLHQHKSGTPTM